MARDAIEFSEGCVQGVNPWQICFDVEITSLDGQPCRHCHSYERVKKGWEKWICPRVIVITPSDPYVGSQVCLDCVLEGVKNFLTR